MKSQAFAACLAASLLTVGSAFAAAPKATKAEPALPTGKAAVTETAVEVATQDEARKVAEAYLQAIAQKAGPEALETLLGGATLSARSLKVQGWKIVGREKHRHEAGEVADLNGYVAAIDAAGRKSLSQLAGGEGGPGADDVELGDVTAEEAFKIVLTTRERAAAFVKSHPVFAYLARVDRPVYWHPANPFRKLLVDAGEKGPYAADLDLFWVETTKGKATKKWPLRVVRFQANGKDTGLRILPASDWNAE